MKLVLVRWRDAWFDPEQLGSEDFRTSYEVQTVGFVVRDSDGVLSIAQEALPYGDGFRAVTHIPKDIIESVVPLAREMLSVELNGGRISGRTG